MTQNAIRDMLREFGLNNLEAEIYLVLVQHPGITGYKIAGILSKPVANTYKALNQLEGKGLIVCNEADGNKSFSAIKVEEYFDKLETDFKEKRKKIVEQINDITIPQKNFGNFNLTDLKQTYERAKHMIDSTREFILIDAFPIPYEILKESISTKNLRKDADIRLKLYHETEPVCDNIINSYNGEYIVNNWVGHWLCICRDGSESLIAAFSRDSQELIHAIWTTDPFICFTVYNGMLNEFMLIDILNNTYRGRNISCEEIAKINSCYNPLFVHEMNLGNRMFEILFRRNKE